MPASPWDRMNTGFVSSLQQLIAASGGRVRFRGGAAGFRTFQQQADLYRRKPKLAAPPGKSNHEFGLAADIEGDLGLAARLAPQFGLRFPMSYEPWHIEPVGAREMRGNPQSFNQAYTAAPSGVTALSTDVNLRDPGYQLASFMAIARGDTRKLAEMGKKLKGDGTGTGGTIRSAQGTAGGKAVATGSDVDRFLSNLRRVESSNNYSAVGISTRYGRATGAYQYLDSTWNNRGGYRRAADAPQEVQDAEARKDAQRLFNKYGSWSLVAMAWHGGEGAANRALRTGRAGGSDGLIGTDEYARRVAGGM